MDVRLGKHISLLYRYSQIFFNRKLKEYNLGSGQYTFLLYLFSNEGINQEQLSVLCSIDKTTTARAVAKLVKEGYVSREVSSLDKRAYVLNTTSKAKEIHAQIEGMLDEWNAKMLKDFTENDLSNLQYLLEHAIRNVLNDRNENKKEA